MKPTFWQRVKDLFKEHPLPMTFLGIIALALVVSVVAAIFFSDDAEAVEPGLYSDPDRPGHGLVITCNRAGVCPVLWFNYSDDGDNLWLWADPLCERGADCDTNWLTTTGSWNSAAVPFEFTEPIGTAYIEQFDRRHIRLNYDVRLLRPGSCPPDLTPGGLLLRECAGSVELTLTAGEP